MFSLPPWLNGFCHYDVICWPTEILRTIFESVDHPEKVSKIIGAPKGLRHT